MGFLLVLGCFFLYFGQNGVLVWLQRRAIIPAVISASRSPSLLYVD
jgi:hypothetical protein